MRDLATDKNHCASLKGESKLISLDCNYTKQYNYDNDFGSNHYSSFWGINFHHRVLPVANTLSRLYQNYFYCKKVLSLLSLLFPIFCYSYDNLTIANALKRIARNSEIDKKILYTLAKIESNFNPLVISFTSKDRNHNFKNLTKEVRKYKDKYLINFKGKERDLQEALESLINSGIRVDVGLMQINSANFKAREIPYIFNPSYNISKSTLILKDCIKAKQNLKDSIECYNKGTKRNYKSYDYYKRFYTSFLRDFARVTK
ncbi:transglycosylase SLT domain-containing protein [Helicobacter turcicus]|uniref:Transglycosylase SLT domain-containing protein n=1 Tax=Helicobacter turcicus TaxID=2867412 RepID=A0ABS7JP89_9HELI|nr:transglycosylase SLT domain-containing protein [Helicobacter turcicus]MBX7491223.1 transglycosylase SLT domain-containing protein [Helicobacter turcicus]MBX7546138.1 transglycosylase SLT domain-containing protein [Helicobacter turcicus]